MARRRSADLEIEPMSSDEQALTLDAGADETATRTRRGRREVRKIRITLSLTEDTVRRLRNCANYENMTPCDVVERLIAEPLRPYVISLRGRRITGESGEAA